jgi:hypothetical protein
VEVFLLWPTAGLFSCPFTPSLDEFGFLFSFWLELVVVETNVPCLDPLLPTVEVAVMFSLMSGCVGVLFKLCIEFVPVENHEFKMINK